MCENVQLMFAVLRIGLYSVRYFAISNVLTIIKIESSEQLSIIVKFSHNFNKRQLSTCLIGNKKY